MKSDIRIIDTSDTSQFVRLSNGNYTLPEQAKRFEEDIEEDRQYQASMAKYAPYKIGDIVYLKSVGGDRHLPTELINKPLRVKSVWHPFGCPKDFWDVDLEGCLYMVTNKDLTTTKPF